MVGVVVGHASETFFASQVGELSQTVRSTYKLCEKINITISCSKYIEFPAV